MAKNPKQSSDKLATLASKLLRIAQRGGPIVVHYEQLRKALLSSGHLSPDSALATIKRELQPYFDDAESLAASVLSQADGPE